MASCGAHGRSVDMLWDTCRSGTVVQDVVMSVIWWQQSCTGEEGGECMQVPMCWQGGHEGRTWVLVKDETGVCPSTGV